MDRVNKMNIQGEISILGEKWGENIKLGETGKEKGVGERKWKDKRDFS